MYVADTGNNRIEKFDAAGHFLLAWGGFGTGNGKFSQPVAIEVLRSLQVGNWVARTGDYAIWLSERGSPRELIAVGRVNSTGT